MVYLDNASTTSCYFYAKDYSWCWGNPNSPHAFGIQAKKQLDAARIGVKASLGVSGGKVIFGHSATQLLEKMFTRINGMCGDNEHDCVFDHCELWSDEYPPCLHDVAFLQYVNQLSGEIFDIKAEAEEVHKRGAFFASDFTAAIGKVAIPKDIEKYCDLIVFSGHKFNAPHIGVMWVSDALGDYIGLDKDSKNEYGFYHGTPDVCSILATVDALTSAQSNLECYDRHYKALREYLEKELIDNGINHYFVYNENETPAINLVTLYGINADALVQYLSTKGIFVGYASSACSAEHDYRVALSCGLSKEMAEQSVRISFGIDNSKADIDEFVDGVKKFKELFV